MTTTTVTVPVAPPSAPPRQPGLPSPRPASEAWVAADRAAARARLAVVSALAVPVVATTVVPALQVGWLARALAAPVVAWGALPFHRRAWRDLRTATPSLDLALALATAAALAGPYPAVAVALTWLALAAAPAPLPRVTGVLLPAALVGAAGVLGYWVAAGGPAPRAAAAVLVLVACPAGLLVATSPLLPLAARAGGEAGVGAGIDVEVAASVGRADTIVVRRRGALTTGRPWLVDVAVSRGVDADEALRIAGSLAQRSPHPVARAVADAAVERGLPLADVEVLSDRPGLGVRGVVDGTIVAAGREPFVTAWAHRLPPELAVARTAAEAAGQIVVLLGWDGAVRAVLVLGDPPRPTAAEAVAALTALGVRPVLASGDGQLAATAVADAVGVREVAPHVLPDATAGLVARLRGEGRVVVAADGPADVVVGPDLWAAVDTVRLARAVTRLARQNVAIALTLAAAGLPLAATGRLTPPAALALTLASAAAVTANGLRIGRFRSLRPPAHRPAR